MARSEFTTRARPLAMIMQRVAERGLKVLVSITNPPIWAMTPDGSDPAQTARLVSYLQGQLPALRAVELFPGANTVQGWGVHPNPAAYVNLIREIKSFTRKDVWIIAGGLTPLAKNHRSGDLDDIRFLEALYTAGAKEVIQLFSVQLRKVTGSPMSTPYGDEPCVMRRYEIIRIVMSRHDHEQGMIWITCFSWPSGKISVEDGRYTDPAHQARCLHQASNLLNAQLYIGVAIFDRLNPTIQPEDAGTTDHNLVRTAVTIPGC